MEAVGRPPPDWGHWGYSEAVLPAEFHYKTGPGSLVNVLAWIKGNPLAPFQGKPAGYLRVEKTLLVLGLTLRELDRVLFSEDGSAHFPDYLQDSPLTLVHLDKAIHGCKALLSTVNPGALGSSTNTNMDQSVTDNAAKGKKKPVR